MERKSLSFDSWIRVVEEGLERFDMSYDPEKLEQLKYRKNNGDASYTTHYEGMTVSIVPYNNVGENFVIKNIIEDIIVFVNGNLTDRAVPLIVKHFKSNPNCSIIYGDEDIATINEDAKGYYGQSVYGSRVNPYFKPDWSPNAFLSHFYFCNMVAIRRTAFRDIELSTGLTGAASIYHTLLRYLYEEPQRIYFAVKHIDEILVHATDYECNDITDEAAFKLSKKLKSKGYAEEFSITNKTSLSVIIPSKDNPQMLEKCISSLYDACPGYIVPEIIVVDNGSMEANKLIIEKLSDKLHFRYEYHPMEFNFARMCNIGANVSRGEFILFLNDDVSFVEPYTLEEMVKQASYDFTGAVGAKLLYPNSKKIQHAGVINNRIGPVHKLQFADDAINHYFGFNRYIQNVLAVTGACILMQKKLYVSVGGMNENLRVAFNDVDLCMKIAEAGYFNVCCNNICLEHAESVSRGKDTDPDALKRLLDEKKKLYEGHPAYKGTDPFYSKYLVADCLDTRIVPANEYEYVTNVENVTEPKLISLKKAKEDDCVFLNIEEAAEFSQYSWDDDEEGYYIQGFSFVTGSNNACYKRQILLKPDESDKCYAFEYEGCLRNDVALNCPDQSNVDLSGFSLYINKELLPEGTYRVGILQTHLWANQKLYRFSNRDLLIKRG
ncbi:MAG: glycosyltransferase [Lachnospiraceae bacterium]|nr:glycosyltransferase [Lachnospiraceae bacterium]